MRFQIPDKQHVDICEKALLSETEQLRRLSFAVDWHIAEAKATNNDENDEGEILLSDVDGLSITGPHPDGEN